MSHTREPWEWSEHQFNAPPYEGRLNNECGIYPPDGERGPVALVGGKEDARRIVACVNACKGIKTESLEMEVLSWITDETGQSALKRERDELLAVLVGVEKRCAPDRFVGQDGQYLKVIRSAIAKVGAGDTAIKD